MKNKLFLMINIFLMIFFFLLILNLSSQKSTAYRGSSNFPAQGLNQFWGSSGYPFGVENPEGKKMFFVAPSMAAEAVKVITDKYQSNPVGGVEFYKVDSWEDTSKLYTYAYESQGELIWKLSHEIDELKSRVKKLENKINILK